MAVEGKLEARAAADGAHMKTEEAHGIGVHVDVLLDPREARAQPKPCAETGTVVASSAPRATTATKTCRSGGGLADGMAELRP